MVTVTPMDIVFEETMIWWEQYEVHGFQYKKFALNYNIQASIKLRFKIYSVLFPKPYIIILWFQI